MDGSTALWGFLGLASPAMAYVDNLQHAVRNVLVHAQVQGPLTSDGGSVSPPAGLLRGQHQLQVLVAPPLAVLEQPDLVQMRCYGTDLDACQGRIHINFCAGGAFFCLAGDIHHGDVLDGESVTKVFLKIQAYFSCQKVTLNVRIANVYNMQLCEF